MLKSFMNSGSLKSVMLRQSENDNGSDDTEGYDYDAVIEAFEEEKGRKFKASKKVLIMAVENNSQWDDWNAEENTDAIFDFMEKVETASAKVAIVDPGITALVDKMNDDERFQTEITECIDALVKNKTTAVDIYGQFRRLFTREEMDGMPFGGSDEDSVKGTNYRPDKIKTKDRVTGVEMTTVWSNDLVSATSWGKAWETELEEVSKELKTAGSSTNPKIKNLSKKTLRGMKSTLEQKRNGLRSMFKRAINLHHQFEAVAAMPLVEIEWMTVDKDGIIIPTVHHSEINLKNKETYLQITKAPKPLWIYPKGKASDGRDISVTQLVNFDVPAALNGENGGTLADLLDTLSKGKDEPATADGDGSGMQQEEALSTHQRWVNYMNNKDNRANIRRLLADKKNTERKDLLENIFAEFHLILPIVRAYKDEYETLTGGEKLPVEAGGKAV